ncbi:MAG: Lanosterol synthase (Oxidosqualene--lanosterol cyclase) [Thelocarpon superellum]|nr:MAG: Lanosterol synthase (Oxidosqualene--lanosterol cyclase) [Thelocarpon superellum]
MSSTPPKPRKETHGSTVPEKGHVRSNGIRSFKEASEVSSNRGRPSKAASTHKTLDATTEPSRWRLLDEAGRQTWHYLSLDEVESWPQTVADKYHLGLPTGMPDLPPARTVLDSVRNGLDFFSHLQLPPGNWASEYGGPLFLQPGLVLAWHVTDTPIPTSHAIEMKRYLFARQNPNDGGWGLHVEGESTVFGTAMNYVVLRVLGVSEEDERMVRARGTLHRLGGALAAPHWAKFWLSVLGACEWDAVNPVPPELWSVFLPMSYIYSRRWSYRSTPLTRQLRAELYTQPYDSIDFASHRNTISPVDNYHPKTWILNTINWLLVNMWNPYLRTTSLAQKAEDWTYDLIRREDENTDYADLAPVNAAMNTVACFVREGGDSYAVQRHREQLNVYLWMNKEGMLCNGTDGVQTWDTAWLVQSVCEAGLADEARWRPMLLKALGFLEDQQIRENCPEQEVCYRQRRKGAWAFSTKAQGYTVSDCVSEALKAVILLQRVHSFPTLVSDQRVEEAVDTLLTMQNASGGFASYEPQRGSEYLEYLNAAEVFGRIMVEYDYPECTTAVVTALSLFSKHFPDYRREEIARVKAGALKYIHRAQRSDGSWYGSWGICFTYAAMFALESLSSVGETYANSETVAKGCGFLLSKQKEDGGWGESYKSCERGIYHQHENSQVVNTAWAVIALLQGQYPDQAPIEKAVRLITGRQQKNGEWLQEAIEGVFNKSCMITFPNYKFYFTFKALGMYAKRFGDMKL